MPSPDDSRDSSLAVDPPAAHGTLLALMEATSNAVWSIDRGYAFTAMNRMFVELLSAEYGVAVRLGLRVSDVLPPAAAAQWMPKYERALAGERLQFRTQMIIDSAVREFEISLVPIRMLDDIRGAAAIAVDVTDRSVRERDLLDSEARFRSLIDASPDGIALTTLDMVIQRVNRKGLELGGHQDSIRVVGRNVIEMFHPDDRALILENAKKLLARGEIHELEYRLRRADGSVIPIELSASIIRDPTGEPIALTAVFRDISARKQAEEQNRLNQILLAESQRVTHTGSWERDLATGQSRWSDEHYRIFGLEPQSIDINSNGFYSRLHPDDRAKVVEAFQHCVATAEPIEIEYRCIRPDGAERYVRSRGDVVTDESGRPIRLLGTCQDVTEQHALEIQFRQAQKMEAVGRLAGGIAHDFNNLLTIISGFTELLSESVPSLDPRRSYIDEITRAAKRASTLTAQLLAFGRKQVMQLRTVKINSFIREAERMLRRILGDDITISLRLTPDLPEIKADPEQLNQVILNLSINARDAMPDGGVLTFETSEVEFPRPGDDKPLDLAPGHYVCLAVRDTGCGMTQEVRSQLFEPFFTTKEVGQGTGLGLPMVYGVIKQSGGDIEVVSEPGKGTTFRLYLPRRKHDNSSTVAVEPGVLPTQGNILVVEDEDSVRSFIRTVLTNAGYRVLPAQGAADALAFAQRESSAIDLVITDVVMPGIGGAELADQIRELRPGIRVLFISGYNADEVVRRGIQTGGINFLNKPFSTKTLVSRVREILFPLSPTPPLPGG